MGMVKRKVSSKAKVDIENFDRVKRKVPFLDMQNVVSLDEIPPALVIKQFSMCPLLHG